MPNQTTTGAGCYPFSGVGGLILSTALCSRPPTTRLPHLRGFLLCLPACCKNFFELLLINFALAITFYLFILCTFFTFLPVFRLLFGTFISLSLSSSPSASISWSATCVLLIFLLTNTFFLNWELPFVCVWVCSHRQAHGLDHASHPRVSSHTSLSEHSRSSSFQNKHQQHSSNPTSRVGSRNALCLVRNARLWPYALSEMRASGSIL